MKQYANVPAFLSKLWTLVEDCDTNEFICWSQNGQSFLVLDEQRFSKEILPKYFKHNNMASFVRQLNMYGFRKVVHVDAAFVKQEKDGPVEFQHPYFRQGAADLLENIKRKVSATRPEDGKVRSEDLSRILNSAQQVQDKQESLDSWLSTLKMENESLWREMSDLRQKHAQQQQVIRKIVQFIVTLVQNNRISLKRKRPLMINTNGSAKPNVLQQSIQDPVGNGKVSLNEINGLKKRDQLSDDIVIYDVTDDCEEEQVEDINNSEETSPRSEHSYASVILEDDDDDDDYDEEDEVECLDMAIVDSNDTTEHKDTPPVTHANETDKDSAVNDNMDVSPVVSSVMQLHKTSDLTSEDPVTMMDSILKESGIISQNINLLGKVELMDYLDSIDCSLEDFQALLSGKQFSMDPDLLTDIPDPLKNGSGIQSASSDKCSGPNSDKQLIQYTSFPLFALVDGKGSPSEVDSSPAELLTTMDKCLEEEDDLLDTNLDMKPPQSKLVRLEPLTEAEASETTLFYLCELTSAPIDSDTSLLDN
ncbi:heat shock factor protein 2 isoform X1 [Protopterus annectens]|uniref:heat shock factor protein 2 isoform X1 n=1 Tax=Protopterus annectens TaxID=7888 RepID=UPI001CFA312B|nr:heat shock factor protein 2 isoform X1 [Protopterus annectens]